MLLTILLAFTPALVSRITRIQAGSEHYRLAAAFRQFTPFINEHVHELQPALAFLAIVSRPVERALDVGHAFLLASLLLVFARAKPSTSPARPQISHATYQITAAVILLLILSYAARQVAFGLSSTAAPLPATVRILTDSLALAVYAWIGIYVFAFDRSGAPRALVSARRGVVVALIFVHATGMAYHYTGLSFAPSPSFGLLLGCAYVVAPLHMLLALVTSYHFPRVHRGRKQRDTTTA
jgi:hypothetical protein